MLILYGIQMKISQKNDILVFLLEDTKDQGFIPSCFLKILVMFLFWVLNSEVFEKYLPQLDHQEKEHFHKNRILAYLHLLSLQSPLTSLAVSQTLFNLRIYRLVLESVFQRCQSLSALP
jgi:hypothetical protein